MTKHQKAVAKKKARSWSRIEVGRPECSDGIDRCVHCDRIECECDPKDLEKYYDSETPNPYRRRL
jgi:hypothetical protein